MSNYYKYNFIEPDPIYANIKEELRSYFETNAVDDVMFPVWTSKCLRKLGKSSLPILQGVMSICDFEGRLPPEFDSVREAWLVTNLLPVTYRKPGAFYQSVSTCLNQDYNQSAGLTADPLPCNDACNPEIVNLVYKTVSSETIQGTLKWLLKPGSVTRANSCARDCSNLSVLDCPDEFEIVGNKFVTNFREGEVYLTYYAEETTEGGYQLIPDNYRIQEFIEAFIKQKLFEQLFNQVTDETYNQIQAKYQLYTQKADEAFLMASIETKKQTIYQKVEAINKVEHRFDEYSRQMYGGYPKRHHPRRRY